MAEVDNHLVSIDGLCDYAITFSKMEVLGGRAARYTFDITGKNAYIPSLSVDVGPREDGLRGMMVRAHDQMINVLRQLLYITGMARGAYEKQPE